MHDGIIIRYGETFLKRGRRSLFLRILKKNISRVLRPLGGYRVLSPYGRMLVLEESGRPIDDLPRVLEALQKVFGIVSMSPCFITSNCMDTMRKKAVAMAARAALEGKRSFRVDARRSDKSYPLKSMEINRLLGEAIARTTGMKVDLEGYEFCLGVEIRAKEAWLYQEVISGPGGLPVGSNGRVLLLLSGGIDSPVAGYLIMKRGAPLELVYFHSPPYISEAALQKTLDIAKVLSAYQGPIRLHVVPFTRIQETIHSEAPLKEAVLLYRRSMFRLAERIARDSGIQALATGENLGQVASQTVENLYCIHAVTHLPVLQPCIGMDKEEIVRLARKIGTYEISVRPHPDCCALFVPRHPDLRGDPTRLERIEEALSLEPLYERALAQREVISVD